MFKSRLLLLLLVTIPVLFTSCDNSETQQGAGDDYDQSDMLENTGRDVILKGYLDMNTKAEALNTSSQAFVEAPDTSTLNQLRSAWKAAYLQYQRVIFYDFGPAESQTYMVLNQYPTDTADMQELIAEGDYNMSAGSNLDTRGFPAVDYLINGAADPDTAVVNLFDNNANYGQYLNAITQQIADKTANIYNTWNDGYVDTFVGNEGTSAGSAISLMVNAWSRTFERQTRDGKFGIPNGDRFEFSDQPFPERVEAYFSSGDFSTELALANLQAMYNFYQGINANGEDKAGLYDILAGLEAGEDGELAQRVSTEFEAAISGTENLDMPLQQAVVDKSEEVSTIHGALQEVVNLIKLEVVSALSISINYQDNDGD